MIVACDNCAYSGSTRGHASHVKVGGSCDCGGRYVEYWAAVTEAEAHAWVDEHVSPPARHLAHTLVSSLPRVRVPG